MTDTRRLIALAALALAPGYLNDFLNMRASGAVEWLAADYGSKLLTLALILALPELRGAVAGAWNGRGLRARPAADTAAWTLMSAAMIYGAFIYIKPDLDVLAPGWKLFTFPAIDDPDILAFDLTAGLALTAVAEELGFRALLKTVIERVTDNRGALVAGSALLFALIHWSNGLGNMAVAFVAGVALMALYLRTGSLWPCVAAHYAVDFLLFA